MADSALDTGRGSVINARNSRIEQFGHAVEEFFVLDRVEYRCPQVVITLDMRRNSKLVNDIGHDNFHVVAKAVGSVADSGVYRTAQVIGIVGLQQKP